MVEKREQCGQEVDIRQMSEEILDSSRDLLGVEASEVKDKLIPRIELYLAEKKLGNWLPEGHDLPLEQECGLNLFLNVINYCYKDPSSGHEYCFVTDDGRTTKRATGLITALARSGVDWDNFAMVNELSEGRWTQMTQISDTNPMYLGDERLLRVKGFAGYLLSLGFQNIDELLSGCEFNASSLLRILSESGYFTDDFQKRSQLACRMINDVLIRRGVNCLEDIDKLTVMADYRIPQIFYNLGVVSIYDPSLLSDLLNEKPILANSREERALRATAVRIGQMVASEVGITEAEADNVLWGLSQEMVRRNEMKIPHMIVATDAY